jgi:TolB protein
MKLLAGILLAAVLCAEPPHYIAARHGGPYMHNYYLPPAPSASPWMPCWSPDGKWIAVSMQGSIWKVNPLSGEAFQLTSGRTYHSSPAWSPDGRSLVYTADDDTRGIQLEIVNLETGAQRALTADKAIYADPVFSSDGTRLAYVSTGETGYFKIYIRPFRDGDWAGDAVLLTPDHRHARERPYVGGWDMHTQPAWTPDGREILFVSNRDVGLGSGELWRIPAEADGMSKATRVFREQSYYRTRPHVSPDGSRLIYTSQAGGADQFNNLYILPMAGGMPVKYTFGDFQHFHPRWSPDGESIAFIASQNGALDLRVLETNGGAVTRVRFTRKHFKGPMGRVRVRVVDAVNGKPTAARIHDLAADGKFYAPPEAYARISGQSRHCFFAAGEFELDAPEGELSLEAVKGYEYRPASIRVRVADGQTAQATLRLERMTDLSARGWYSSSTHVHMNYGGNLLNTPESLALAAAAEHVRIVNAHIANTDNRFFDYQYFAQGREHPLNGLFPEVKISFGQEYRSQFYGHVYLAGLRDHIILPYGTAYEGGALASPYPTNADMLRKAKAQGAVTGYVHPFGETDPLESGLGAKAFPVDAALGLVDTLDWAAALRGQLKVWFRMLNNDFRIAPTGGEDSIVDLHNRKLIGAIRTYAYLGKTFTVDAWYDALRKGRTFFSTGPLIEFTVNGKLPGEQIDLPAAGPVTVEATVWSIAPLTKITLYHRRGVVREFTPAAAGPTRIRAEVPVEESDWLMLAAEGPPTPALDADYLLAACNAVRVYVGGKKIRSREDAEYFLKWIDKLTAMTNAWPWWRSEAEKKRVFAQYDEARAVYRRLAAEAGK